MGSNTEINKENIIPSTYEHLPKDVRLLLEERKKKRDEEDLQAALVSIEVDRRGKVTKIKEIDFASTSSDASTEVDQNPFPVHVLELNNPKVLVRPSQAESTKGKNVVIGDERPEKKLTQKISQGAKTLRGQDKKKKTDNKSTGQTGHSDGLTDSTGRGTGLTGAPSKSGNSSKIKTIPSFKEHLAKYEKKGSAQRQKGPPSEVKDTGSSSRHQEQLSQGNYTSSSGPIAPWYCWYPHFYTLMDYSMMHMQSYYIQYPPMYPNYALLQRPIVASNNPVKQDIDCSKENEKSKE